MPCSKTHAFSYTFAANNGVNIVTHPIGYSGSSGVISISIGIDPTSMNNGVSNTANMVVSVNNVIRTWNALSPTNSNFSTGTFSGSIDFESVLLHEMGHSIGLAHTNVGAQSGIASGDRDFSNSTEGADGSFDFGAGVDGILGTRDDVRDDDVNLTYFRKTGTAAETNNPFTIAGTVDSTTYSRDLADLPAGDLYAGNASYQNAGALGVAFGAEAAMNQGTPPNEIQRTLGFDDVAGLLYAQSGLDNLASTTADNYTLVLTYAGITTGADIMLDFDSTLAGTNGGLAVSKSSGIFLSADDVGITANSIFFDDTETWFYNQVNNPEPSSMALICLFGSSFCGVQYRKRRKKLLQEAK